MKTRIRNKKRRLVGVYDHLANTMETDDPWLKAIPDNGVPAFGGNTAGRLSATGEAVITFDDPEFFFALVDAVERRGFNVDKETEKQYVNLRRAQRGEQASP